MTLIQFIFLAPLPLSKRVGVSTCKLHMSHTHVFAAQSIPIYFRRNYQKLRTSPQRFQPFSHFFFTAINLLIFGYDAFAIDIRRHFRIRVIYQKKMDGEWVWTRQQETLVFSVSLLLRSSTNGSAHSPSIFFIKLRKPNMSLLFINCSGNFYFIHRVQMDSVYAMRKQILHLTFGVI